MEGFLGLQIFKPETTMQMVSFILVPSFILAVGTFDDLRSKKIHNKLILCLLPFAIIFQFLGFGFSGLGYGGLAFLVALSLSAPMVLSGMLGGGDMKLFAVFGLATNLNSVLYVGFYSLFWGALFGILRAILIGQGLVMMYNVIGLVKQDKPSEAHLTKIPYSVALLFGWMTYLSIRGMEGRL